MPDGWLLCDGSPYSGYEYPGLYNAIGMNFGSVSGTVFKLSDLRGVFLRGVDGGKGKDPDVGTRTANGDGETDAPGSRQEDAFKSHHHGLPRNHGNTYSVGDLVNWIDSNNAHSDCKLNSRNTGGNETRPKNVYVHYSPFWVLRI